MNGACGYGQGGGSMQGRVYRVPVGRIYRTAMNRCLDLPCVVASGPHMFARDPVSISRVWVAGREGAGFREVCTPALRCPLASTSATRQRPPGMCPGAPHARYSPRLPLRLRSPACSLAAIWGCVACTCAHSASQSISATRGRVLGSVRDLALLCFAVIACVGVPSTCSRRQRALMWG